MHPLIDAGAMPNLDRLISGGVMGNLFSAPPMQPPVLDATLATGCYAPRHRVLNPLAATEVAPGFRRTQGCDWARPAFWEIAAQAGLSSAAVGWPATHPASAFQGLVVSDRFCDDQGKTFDDWAFDPATINDPEVAEALSDLRMHPSDLTAELIEPFIPELASVDLETDPRLGIFANCFARAMTAHAAATWIGEQRRPDLLTVHFDFLSIIKSNFTQFSEPKMGHVSDGDFERYSHVVNGAYQLADMMLGAYFALADDNTYLMLMSGHGFQSGAFRPGPQPKGRAANGARLYRELGAIAVRGPGLSEDTLAFGALNIDMAPTALAMLGVSCAELKGKVLFGLDMAEFAPLKAKLPDRGAPIEEPFAHYRLKQLIGLELLTVPSKTPELASETIERDGQFALVTAHLVERNFSAANDACDAVLELDPDHRRANLTKIDCLQRLKRNSEAASLIASLRNTAFQGAELDFQEGKLAASVGDMERATEVLLRAENAAGSQLSKLRMLERIGQLWLDQKDYVAAKRVFDSALELDPKSARANGGLGRVQFANGSYKEAVSAFRASLAKLRAQPSIHARLGQAHLKLGEFVQAEEAFLAALKMAPELKPALAGLIELGQLRGEPVLTEGTKQ